MFVGPKTGRAIPTRGALRRDFLVQSTLDPCIRRIEYHPAMRSGDEIVQVDALIVDSDFGRHAVDFVDDRPDCDPNGEHLMDLAFAEGASGITVVTRTDIRREPRFSASREVWRHHAVRIGVDDRTQVVLALEREGPVPLRSLRGLTDTDRDIETVVYSMACGAELELDVFAGLDDRSIVRLGMRYSMPRLESFGT